MISKQKYEELKEKTLAYFDKAHIVLTEEEKSRIEVADFNLNMVEQIGLQLLVYVNTERCCAKELVLLPGQICPEHRHPRVNGREGKEETFRCRMGEVYLYVTGEAAANPLGTVPKGKEHVFTVWHEIRLRAGEQYTLAPDTWHWFQGGKEGAIVSEFSTSSTDECDIFRDEAIARIPIVSD